MTRTGKPGLPRLGASSLQSLISCLVSADCLEDMGRARTPACCSNSFTQALVIDGSARSCLLSTLIQGLVRRSFFKLVVGAGKRQAGIEHLDNHIDPLDQLADLLQGLAHMSGIPFDGHRCGFFPCLM